MDKPVAIVLGGTNPHKTLINHLKNRGYYVVLVDYLPNSPSKSVADMHVQESALDKEKVLEIAQVCNAALVITTNIDQANVTACYVAEKLGLPRPYSYETALDVTDKSRMKKIMWDNEIPTSKYITVKTIEEALVANIKYPVVVKPVDSNGSRGIHRCDSDDDLKIYLPVALEASRTDKAIIESFVCGEEVSFYYFIQDYVPHYITSNQRFKFVNGDDSVIQSAGGVYPAPQPETIYNKMNEIAQKIAKAFDLKSTPIFIQAIIVQDEEVFVLEFAPRIGGGLSFRLIEEDNKFDIINAAIGSFLNEKDSLDIIQPNYYSAVMNVYAPNIVMGEVMGVDKIIEDKKALEFHQYKLKNSDVNSDMSSGSRIGAFFVRGKDYDEIRANINSINEYVEVYDIHGVKSMRHDIYPIP